MLKIPFKITKALPSDMSAEKIRRNMEQALRYKLLGIRFVVSDEDYRILNK